MRWSALRPYAVDLRSARATPAPPVAMVAYSSKLAVTTTLTSLVFSGLARTDHPEVSVLGGRPVPAVVLDQAAAAPATSGSTPSTRAPVVMAVAG